MKAKIFVGGPETGKTRTAKMIAEYFRKDEVGFIEGRKLGRRSIKDDPWIFSHVPSECKLLIIDDVSENFDYEFFYPIHDYRYNGGILRFIIDKQDKGKEKEMLLIPHLIFTTNKLPESWTQQESFNSRFEVVDFGTRKEITISSLVEKYDLPYDFEEKLYNYTELKIKMAREGLNDFELDIMWSLEAWFDDENWVD